jgi:hypothetical protein
MPLASVKIFGWPIIGTWQIGFNALLIACIQETTWINASLAMYIVPQVIILMPGDLLHSMHSSSTLQYESSNHIELYTTSILQQPVIKKNYKTVNLLMSSTLGSERRGQCFIVDDTNCLLQRHVQM